MNYKVGEKKENKIVIEFSLDAQEWENEVQKAYEKNKGKYKKEGFRQGKVPRKVLEQTYGEYLFYEDAFNECCPIYYGQMLDKETEIFPVDYPDISITSISKDGVKFKATVTVMPEIKLGEYKGITIKKDKVKITNAQIDAKIEQKREQQARFVEVTDRPAKIGDLVNLDYSGSVDGVVFEGGTAKNQELTLGSHTFIDTFEDQMVGMNIGEEKDLNVTFPEHYGAKELAGKKAVFKVKLLGIREKVLPEVNDDFAKDISEFNSLSELKADIKKRLTEESEHEAQMNAENKLIDTIVDKTEINIPDCMIENQIDNFVEDISHQLSHQGLKFEDYLKYTGTTMEDYRNSRREDAKKNVKTTLTLQEIVKDLKLEVTDKDIDTKLEELAKHSGRSAEELKKSMNATQENLVRNSALTDKLMAKLKELNNIE